MAKKGKGDSIADLSHNLGSDEWKRLQRCHVTIEQMKESADLRKALGQH